MSKVDQRKTIFQELKELEGAPDELAAFASAILDVNHNQQELEAALQALADNPYPRARPRLIELFEEYASNGEILDPGGGIRAWIIRALQAIAKPVDASLFETAALTYEILPPGFEEEAGALRIAGVAALAQVDDELAAFHASRILVERYTEPMSGEPAVTAARILASLNQFEALYQYLFHEPHKTLPEVVSECLHLLTSIATSLVPGLIDRFSDSENDLILAGLFDLLVIHKSGLQGEDFLISFLKESRRYDAYRYLIALIAAERRQDFLPAILPVLGFERDKEKVFILLEAFDPLKNDLEIADIVERLKQIEQ